MLTFPRPKDRRPRRADPAGMLPAMRAAALLRKVDVLAEQVRAFVVEHNFGAMCRCTLCREVARSPLFDELSALAIAMRTLGRATAARLPADPVARTQPHHPRGDRP